MKISVIGCGRWGAFIAWYLGTLKHEVTVFGRENSKSYTELKETRSNGMVTLDDSVQFTSNLGDAVTNEIIVISVPSQNLRNLMEEMRQYGPAKKIFVLCMKGIEISTTKRLSEVVSEFYGRDNSIAVWIGPGHPQEFVKGIPNCMVIDSLSEETKKRLISEFSSHLIRFYYGTDLIGNEIGAATKNVIGIAAGMLDGLELSSLKGALMSRATREVSRLISSLGGDGRSAYGLCHLGDYEATVFSEYSHNRSFGEAFVKGIPYSSLAEGYYTAEAVHRLATKNSVDMPICEAVYQLLYEGKTPEEMLNMLFARSLKKEF